MTARWAVLGAVAAIGAFAVIGGGFLWTRPQFERGPWLGPEAPIEPVRPPKPIEPVETLEQIPTDLWLNAPEEGLSGGDLRGEVVLVEYWTYLCDGCRNIEEWMKEIHDDLGPKGLVMIGVHTPELDVEREVANVRRYVRENGIVWPVAIDNDGRVWRKYNATRARPALLVYDREGRLVYRGAGERAVHGARLAIEKALAAPRTDIEHDPRRVGRSPRGRLEEHEPRRTARPARWSARLITSTSSPSIPWIVPWSLPSPNRGLDGATHSERLGDHPHARHEARSRASHR
ncbi:MAG TPA: redoxin domain-containing protein [Gemmatimonadota bacterium]|nr:redoxin domain-containing protein [Gemmatimonadota bacterium]